MADNQSDNYRYMNRFVLLLFVLVLGVDTMSFSQNFDEMRKRFDDFKNQNRKEFTDFRNQCNREYADFMRAAWEQFGAKPPVERPVEEKPVEPIDYVAPDPGKEKKEVVKHEFDEVIEVEVPQPQPEPAFPIVERPKGAVLPGMGSLGGMNPKVQMQNREKKIQDTIKFKKINPEDLLPYEERFEFVFLGTRASVRIAPEQKIMVTKCKEGVIADAWEKYSSGDYDNLIYDCLQLRVKHSLCDWAYLTMLHELSKAYYGEDNNSAVLMTAYIFCQSGYQIRLGMGNEGTKLVLLYASRHMIFEKPYFTLDDGENYYTFNYEGKTLNICKAKFPKEQPLSLLIGNSLALDTQDFKERKLQSKQYASANADVRVNKNLIDFYDNYPASILGDNTMTRWAMYANAPLDMEVVDALYPSLRKSIEGKSEADALNVLLNFVQTAFVYEYDNKVWGRDRVFFAEETLYYPYCDCEDRSILFSRLVRDLLKLDVLLVYYPGHLATAVKLNQQVRGDYIILNDGNYIVCDPTYINAPIGETMPKMDNSKAKLILLK